MKVGKEAQRMAEDANDIAADPAFWRGFVAALRYDNAMPWADTKAVYDVMLTMKTETAAGTILAELLSHALPAVCDEGFSSIGESTGTAALSRRLPDL